MQPLALIILFSTLLFGDKNDRKLLSLIIYGLPSVFLLLFGRCGRELCLFLENFSIALFQNKWGVRRTYLLLN